ncbi:Opticin [Achaetomium macrosporum]|uniref:Opticin n=1 Tax=Achaetomium macrosporum TaxID=79813 RepID=A0AAN7C1J8_9PEZI|nr:Opticin [Achaetomium macrosporum]
MALLVGILLTSLATLAAAFGTINEPVFLGQHNEHEMITRLAFQCESGKRSDGTCFEPRSLDQLAGYHRDVMGVAIPGAGFNGAVGSPDTFDPVPEGHEAHCDNADYLDVPGYAQTREEANAKLQACVDHLRSRFRQGLKAAERLLDDRRRIRQQMVQLSTPYDCGFAFPALQGEGFGRAKCSVIEGFGRALHGIQDFYAHSNWADSADPTRAINVSNPPGLGFNGTAPFLDMRASGTIPPDQIPHNLTTGCFSIPDNLGGSGECQGRITHYGLSKDTGSIHLDGTFGEVPCYPRSEAASDNFQRAVLAAIQHSRDAWDGFREELRLRYGTVSGNLMICALTRDDPVRDCRKRTVVLALDSSVGDTLDHFRLLEGRLSRAINSRLTGMHGLDRVAVVEFHDSARLLYPMGYPNHATFDLSSSPGGPRRIASGLELGIAETIYAQPETYTDRGAVVLVTAGAEAAEFTENTLKQLHRAREEGVRVHFVCINTYGLTGDHPVYSTEWSECSHNNALVPAVVKTGGIAAFIDEEGGRTPTFFANLVMDHGLTATDDEDAAEDTRVYPGITCADVLSPGNPAKSFSYPVSAGESLNITISSVALVGQGSESCFTVTLWNKGLGIKIATHTRCGNSDPLSLFYEALSPLELILEVEYGDTLPEDVLLHREEIVFTLALNTSMPDKDEPTVSRTTSILSTSTTTLLPGASTQDVPTSEMLEVVSSIATVEGATRTSSQCFRKSGDGGGAASYHPSFDPSMMCGIPNVFATADAGVCDATDWTLDTTSA